MTKVLDAEVLDSPERLQVLQGGVIEREPDPLLQSLVREAAELTGFPIALVSLVMRRTQYFRAHVGLPADLEISRSTDRCSSFCQFVVSSGAVFEVEDATLRNELPQELIESYGIRAYVGVPVRIGSQVAGSLCVIDAQPRKVSDEQMQGLLALASRVSARLEEMADTHKRGLTQTAATPAFNEVRTALSKVRGGADMALVGMAELRPLGELVRHAAAGTLSASELHRSCSVLGHAALAVADVEKDMGDVRRGSQQITDEVIALEAALVTEEGDENGALLERAVDAATILSRDAARLVERVRVFPMEPGLRCAAPRGEVILGVAAALRALAARIDDTRRGAIDLSGEALDEKVVLTLFSTGLSFEDATALETQLARFFNSPTSPAVSRVGCDFSLTWPAA